MTTPRRILVIKLSALGDFIQAMGPFAAIRVHHPEDRITLLTTQPYAKLAEASPYFDDIWTDSRPKPWQVREVLRLRKRLRSGKFDMVYDLQTSERSSNYFHIMGDPPWSGIAHGCLFPHANPDRNTMHTIDRQAEQLAMAGIPSTPLPDLSWLTADVARWHLPDSFVLLVPGGSPHRPTKRWPSIRYADLANWLLLKRGFVPVLLGTGQEAMDISAIATACPGALSLTGQTTFADIAELARHAAGAVGNDTGPMHLIAAAGCPSVVLFSNDSNPALCAPRGAVEVIRCHPLDNLGLAPVQAALSQGSASLRDLSKDSSR